VSFFHVFINLQKLIEALHVLEIHHWPLVFQNIIENNKMHFFFISIVFSTLATKKEKGRPHEVVQT
jgi:hypothetical protein